MKLRRNAFAEEQAAEILEDASAYLDRLGVRPSDLNEKTLLGTGSFARAYALPDGNVLKLTTDRDDAEAAELVRRDGPVGGLAHVYDVRRFSRSIRSRNWDAAIGEFNTGEESLYAVVSERVQPAAGSYGTALRHVYDAFYDATSRRAGWRLETAGAVEQTAELVAREHELDTKEGRLLLDLLSGWEWLRDHGYDVGDIHVGNLGQAEDGRIVLFDFGADSHRSGERPEIDLAANPGQEELSRTTRHFERCFRTVEKRFPDFGSIELVHDEKAGGDNGAGADRQYAYCAEGDPIVIAFAAKAEDLPDENIAGLMSHEFGHALEHRYGVNELEKRLKTKLPKTVERRADVIAELVFQRMIQYDAHEVQCVDCEGVSPRPGHLAKNGPDDLRLTTDVRGAHHNQVDASVYAIRNERYVGRLDYSEYNGRPSIQWIEVLPEERKAGIAKAMIGELLKEYAYDSIDWGMTTPDGAELKRAMDREFSRELHGRLARFKQERR